MAVAWSQLPDEIWSIIGDKLRTGADRIRFRSVCQAWRSLLPFPQPPWLMLAEDESTPNTRGFVGLGQQEEEPAGSGLSHRVYQFDLPEAYHTKTVGSTGTWLITVDLDMRVRVLNPFTRAQIDLPRLTTLPLAEHTPDQSTPLFRRNFYLAKVVLSASGGGNKIKDCVAIALYQPLRQAYARPGDKSWTCIPHYLCGVLDVIFYKGGFYGITTRGVLIAFNLDDVPVSTTQLAEPFRPMNTNRNVRYLVECGGGLLFVFRFADHEFDPVTRERRSYILNRFEVFKFDFARKEWTLCKDLGDYCLFLGLNTSIALSTSSHPGLRKNCIYFTDDFIYTAANQISKGHDMGIYDLKDDTVRPHYRGPSTTSMYAPPLWIVP